jgi:hypothetical protein
MIPEAAVRPLVRMPTVRRAAQARASLGEAANKRSRLAVQEVCETVTSGCNSKPRDGKSRAHISTLTQNRNTATATTQVQRPEGSPSAAAAIEVLSMIRLLCS